MATDDGEGVEDVGGVCAGEAVEVEVEGVEAGALVAAFFFVPDVRMGWRSGTLGKIADLAVSKRSRRRFEPWSALLAVSVQRQAC